MTVDLGPLSSFSSTGYDHLSHFDIQWTNRFIGELKTRNIREYLFNIAPETPTNVDAKFQAIDSEFQPEEDSHDDNNKISKVVRLKRELKALREDNKLQSKVQEGLFCFFIKDN
jgi:hypothetical protein